MSELTKNWRCRICKRDYKGIRLNPDRCCEECTAKYVAERPLVERRKKKEFFVIVVISVLAIILSLIAISITILC